MENTTKMLLIAAAVLIVIILVTFGIKIINPIKDTSEQASILGKSMQDYMKGATSSAIEGINSGANFYSQNVIRPEEFNSEVFKILKMDSNQTFFTGSEYKYIQNINLRKNTKTALEELEQLKTLCERTGREIKIGLRTSEDSVSISDFISLLNSDSFKIDAYGFGRIITDLHYIKADKEKGYIYEIIYSANVSSPWI